MRAFNAFLAVAAMALCAASAVVASDSSACACEEDRTECSDRAKTSIRPQDICPGSTVWIFCDNALPALPRGVDERVEELDVARNRIAAATDELAALSGLRKLHVAGNRLQHLRFLPQPCGLTDLDASENSISTLEGPLSSCAQLKVLRLAGNELITPSDGAFPALRSLTMLSLAQNPLRTLSPGVFRGLVSLNRLELSSAELTELPDGAFAGLGELQLLDLDNNHLRSLARGALRGLTALSSLHLCDNHIAELPANAFGEVRNLTYLFLNNNVLVSFPEGVFAGLPLVELWVQHNNLEQLPVLRDCCEHLRVAAFDSNRVVTPSAAAVQALLRESMAHAGFEGNPVCPDALMWAARAPDMLLRASLDCHCGEVANRSIPHAAVSLCVDVECGPSGPWVNWVEAVRTAAQNAV